jgi:hypothetical protein
MSKVAVKPVSVTEQLHLIGTELFQIFSKWNTSKFVKPDAYTIECIYKEHRIEPILEWLKVNVSIDYAEDLWKSLYDPLDKLKTFHFRALQILDGDYAGTSKEARFRQDAIRRAFDFLMYEMQLEEEYQNTDQYEYWERYYNELSTLDYEVSSGLKTAAIRIKDVIGVLKSKFGKSTPNISGSKVDNTNKQIPPEKRTKPMSYRTAASHIGKALGKKGKKHGAEWLKQCINDGTIKCESLTRQTHIFSIDDFPASALPLIQPNQK